MASNSLWSYLLVDYEETEKQNILSFISKILTNIIKHPNVAKYRAISRDRLQKKTKNWDVICSVLYIAGFEDNESETRLILSENNIIAAKNVFAQIPSKHRSQTVTNNALNTAATNQRLIKSESATNTQPVQTLIDMGFSREAAINALQATSGNIALATQIIIENQNQPIHEIERRKCCVKTCQSLSNLSKPLNAYKGTLTEHIPAETISLLNDFNHLLLFHDSDSDFECIYNALKTKCEIKHCSISKRHLRDRSMETTEMSRISLAHATMDRIHTYLLHSYDTGYRLRSQENIMCHKPSDTQYANKKSLNKYSALSKADKELSLNHYSFGQQFYYWDYFKNDAIASKVEDPLRHRGYQRNEWYISPKYGSFKEELTHNRLASITNEQFDAQHRKAVKHHATKRCKTISAQSHEANQMVIDPTIFDIIEGTQITVQHLMAVSAYCAYSHLCSRFSGTYRRLYDADEKEYVNDVCHSVMNVHDMQDIHRIITQQNVVKQMHSDFGSEDRSRESDYAFKKRHSNFYHLARYLFEAVNVFTVHSKSNGHKSLQCFHGTTKEFLFDSMKCSLHQPFSTTTSLAVAAHFGDAEGVILTIKSEPSTRYFECRYLSIFPAEREVLYVENFTPIMIQNIQLMQEADDLQIYIQAINVLESMISDIQMYQNKTYFDEMHDEYFSMKNQLILIDLMDSELAAYDTIRYKKHTIHSYVVNLFHNLCIKRQLLDINWKYLHMMMISIVNGMSTSDFDGTGSEQQYFFLKSIFCVDEGQMLNLHVLCTLFPNVTTILLHAIEFITVQTLSYLLNYLSLDKAKKLCSLVVYLNAEEIANDSINKLVNRKEIVPLIKKLSLLKWKMEIKTDHLGRNLIAFGRIIIQPIHTFDGHPVFCTN